MNLEQQKKFDYIVGGLGAFSIKPFVMLLGKILKRDHSLTPKGNVLVIKILGGGSLVLAYTGLRSLKKSLKPDQKLILVTTKSLAPFARELNVFDDIYAFGTSSAYELLTDVVSLLPKIVGKIDTCIDFEVHSRCTAILSIISGARNRFGFFKDSIYWRVGLYTHLVFYNTYSRSSDFYESLIGLAGINIEKYDSSLAEFSSLHKVPKLDTVTIGFSCSGNAPERMLRPRQWAEYLKKIGIASSTTIELLGGSEDFDLGEKVKLCIENALDNKCVNLSGQLSLRDSIRKIAASYLFIGIDSGLLHFARLLEVETISFWGPTDPNTRLSQRIGFKDTVHYRKISCSPCVHFAATPPCQGKNKCIDEIFVDKLEGQHVTWAVVADKDSSVEIVR